MKFFDKERWFYEITHSIKGQDRETLEQVRQNKFLNKKSELIYIEAVQAIAEEIGDTLKENRKWLHACVANPSAIREKVEEIKKEIDNITDFEIEARWMRQKRSIWEEQAKKIQDNEER